ncbi:MAG: hypothetical protein IJ748_03680 [Bacteroidales bacterium]|nr:hypothetical protein [Bacteroidales bacterium]
MNIFLTLQPVMKGIIGKYKFLSATFILLFFCLFCSTDNKSAIPFPSCIQLNTKVVLSYVSHTCSPADIENNTQKSEKNGTAFALKESKYLPFGQDFGFGTRMASFRSGTLLFNTQFDNYRQNGIIIHKTLEQIGVLLI